MEGCNISPTDLPISEALMRDFARWQADYDIIGEELASDRYDAVWEVSPSFPVEWFNDRGDALKIRLENELGLEWTVEHRPLQRSYERSR